MFQPGQRVEGFSSPLWLALLTAAASCGAAIGVAAKFLGALCGAAVVLLVARAPTGRVGTADQRLAATLLAVLLASIGPLAFYAVSGLETAAYGLILVGLALLLPDPADTSDRLGRGPGPGRGAAICGASLAAALARPEGLAVLGLVLAWGAVRWRGWRVRAVLAATAATAASLLWLRHGYYGAWLPNTYLAKPGVSSVSDLVAGVGYVARAVWMEGRWVELALALWALRRREGQAALALFALGLGFAVWSGGDWMLGGRFLVPYLPLLAIAARPSLARMLGQSSLRGGVLAALCVLIVVRLVLTAGLAVDLDRGGVYDHAHVSHGNVALGRYLASHGQAGERVLTDEIGAIGLVSGLEVLDLWGLVDPHVARLLREHGLNPYAGSAPVALRHRAQAAVVAHLMASRPEWVTVDYRGPVSSPVDLDRVNPVTMPELTAAVVRDGYELVERFNVDPLAPKSFLLFRRR